MNTSLEEKEKELIALTKFWYDFVSCDHHKDRDCHFYVSKTWSYAQEPVYRAEHYGYMARDFEGGSFETYEEALDCLLEFLRSEVKNVYENIPSNWDDEKEWDYNWPCVLVACRNHNLFEVKNV